MVVSVSEGIQPQKQPRSQVLCGCKTAKRYHGPGSAHKNAKLAAALCMDDQGCLMEDCTGRRQATCAVNQTMQCGWDFSLRAGATVRPSTKDAPVQCMHDSHEYSRKL